MVIITAQTVMYMYIPAVETAFHLGDWLNRNGQELFNLRTFCSQMTQIECSLLLPTWTFLERRFSYH